MRFPNAFIFSRLLRLKKQRRILSCGKREKISVPLAEAMDSSSSVLLKSGASEMIKTAIPLVLVAAIGIGGCGATTGERAGSGALMGAAGGALIGSLSANAGAGALIGAGVGALGGYLYDQHKKGYID